MEISAKVGDPSKSTVSAEETNLPARGFPTFGSIDLFICLASYLAI